MAVDNITGYTAVQRSDYAVAEKKAARAKDSGEGEVKKTDAYAEAATFEKSADAVKTDDGKVNDRSAIIAQLKADAEQQVSNLLDIVRKTIGGQGKAASIATDNDSLWKKLASGDFTVDAETKAQAQKDISEDGYWGVNKTSDRILDFAKALSGNDPEKAEELLGAFKKGFEEATKTWGKDLPEISQKTYDAVVEKFNKWRDGEE